MEMRIPKTTNNKEKEMKDSNTWITKRLVDAFAEGNPLLACDTPPDRRRGSQRVGLYEDYNGQRWHVEQDGPNVYVRTEEGACFRCFIQAENNNSIAALRVAGRAILGALDTEGLTNA